MAARDALVSAPVALPAPLPRLLGTGKGPTLRDVVGRLLRISRQADFALGRIRLAAVDLLPQEMTGIERCRVLIGRLDAATLLDAALDARRDASGRRRIAVLRELAMSGSLEARAAGIEGWSPDFSVFRGSVAPVAALIGAHWFHTPPAGTASTAILHGDAEPSEILALTSRFEALWAAGHDVLDVVREALDAGAAEPRPLPRVGEARPGWPDADVRDVVRLIGERCFGTGKADGASHIFELATFQAEAARRADAVLQRRGGVLIADGVGVGKTYIALALIESRIREGGSVAVVIPAVMRRQWLVPLRRLCTRLRLPPPAESGGGQPIRVLVVTHAQLSRRQPQARPQIGLSLVVVDEAHAFRNPATNRYRALAELCRGVPVALLTATPVNNSPLDLYWLLRLFAGNGDFADVGIADLLGAFREAAGATGIAAPEVVQPVMRAAMVRRTRPFLRDHYSGVRLPATGSTLVFPKREPPRSVDYRLRDTAPEALPRIRAALARFGGHVFSSDLTLPQPAAAGERVPPPGHGGVAALLRLLLLKRLESGVPAFRSSVRRQVDFHEAALRALREGRLPEPRASVAADDADPLQLRLDELLLRPLPRSIDADELSRRVAADLDRLHELLRATSPLDGDADPKLAALRQLLDELRGRKVLIFTEYRDTARYLHRALAPRGGVGLVDGAEARAGTQRCGRTDVIRRFAPIANGAPEPTPAQRIDVLIATDVLAEGLNLQDAADVVCYDLPWNPVRIVQRIGRVDRLGARHASVRAWHFLPEARLERMLRIADRLRRKIATIVGTVGSTEKILPAAPAIAFPRDVVARLRAGDPAVLEDIERDDAAPFELDERLRLELSQRLHDRGGRRCDAPLHARVGIPAPSPPSMPRAADETEPGWGSQPPPGDPPRMVVLVALETSRGSRCVIVEPGGRVRRDDAVALRLLIDVLADQERTTDTARMRAGAPSTAARRAIAAALAGLEADGGTADPLAGASLSRTARRAVARLLRAISLEPAPAADLCRRADTLLHALRTSAQVVADLRLREALRRLGPIVPGDALRVIETLEATILASKGEGSKSEGTNAGSGKGEGGWSQEEVGETYGSEAQAVRVLASLEFRPTVRPAKSLEEPVDPRVSCPDRNSPGTY